MPNRIPHTPHVDPHYEAELGAIAGHLALAGDRARAMTADACRGIAAGDERLARSVIERDRDLNRLENETDQLCARLLARRSPVGSDLRLVLSALKVVIDLERIGDLATNIAKRSLDLPGRTAPDEVNELAVRALAMLDHALDALKTRDADLARRVRDEDKPLDDMNKAIFRAMIARAKDQPQTVEEAFAWTSVSRHLERIGDHACNVAEMVVFLVEGKVLRHAPSEPDRT